MCLDARVCTRVCSHISSSNESATNRARVSSTEPRHLARASTPPHVTRHAADLRGRRRFGRRVAAGGGQLGDARLLRGPAPARGLPQQVPPPAPPPCLRLVYRDAG